MSLMPAFSPYKSAYRVDNLSFLNSEVVDSGGGFRYTFAFSTDGKIFLWCEPSTTNDWYVYRKALSVAWDTSTFSSLTRITFADRGPTATSSFNNGLLFTDGGSTVIGAQPRSGPLLLLKYSLSSPYGGSSTFEQEHEPSDSPSRVDFVFFSGSGTRVHYVREQVIYFAELSIAYDLSTVGAQSIEKDFTSDLSGEIRAACWGKTENTLILTDSGANVILEYRLSIAGNISSATFTDSYAVPGLEFKDIGFGDGGRKFYGIDEGVIYEYASVA